MKTLTMMILLALAANTAAGQNSSQFSHTLTTSAPASDIWRIWTDVPNWHVWDSGLRSAELLGPFALGTKGKLLPDKGPKARFRITEFSEGQGYTFATSIPLGKLIVARRLHREGNQTVFTHDVQFTGPLKGIFARSLGKRYRKMLPEAMEAIRRLAETQS
ncbi:MAG: SRPBCC family protein [Bacteroidota bacterium]